MEDLLSYVDESYVQPIVQRSGYNAVNTIVYAALAILGLYAVYWVFRKEKVKFEREFFLLLLCFVLLGSAIRVVTDAVDSGVLQYRFAYEQNEIVARLMHVVIFSRVYEYGLLTVTPGIYVVVALLFVCTALLFNRLGKMGLAKYVPLALLAPHALLLLVVGQNWAYAALIAVLAAGAYLAVRHVFAAKKWDLQFLGKCAVFAHALDGAATFVAKDLFPSGQYFEQHVLSGAIGEATPLGFGLFFAAKVLLAAAVVYIIGKEEARQEEKDFILMAIIVMGLAPGVRDLLRLLAGT